VRRGVGFFVVVLVVGAVTGSLLGEILAQLVPSGAVHSLFSRGISVGIPHFSVNLLAITLSLGLMVRVNLCTLIGLAAAFYWLRR
jgi:hypothetical protein